MASDEELKAMGLEDIENNKKSDNTWLKEIIKKYKKKLIIIGVLLIIIIVIAIIQIINYNMDLKKCYNAVKTESGWEEFQSLIDKHFILSSSFEEKAYQQLDKVMDEEIEKIKNENYTSETQSINWLEKAQKSQVDEKYKKNIKTKQQLIKVYKTINTVRKIIENGLQKVKEQGGLPETLPDYILNEYDLCKEGKNLAKKEQNKIKDKAINQAIEYAQEEINKENYSEAQKILERFTSLKNETITDLYQTCEQKIKEEKKAEEERRNQEEKERIEKEKFNYEVYCYFNLIAWNEKDTITDDIAYSKCAKKFGITKEQAKEIYKSIEKVGYSYQSKYPSIFEKYASQYK